LIDDQIDYRWQMLQLRLFEKRISEAFVVFRQNRIEPILIKGWAAAQLYPHSFQRKFVDIDLIIAPNLYEDAKTRIAHFKGKYFIDLHCGARHLDHLSYERLFADSKIVKCGEADVRVLRHEDHLRILCVHWLRNGGEDQEKLWDIYYAVENRPVDFDWDRCLNVVGEIRKKWVICAIGIAQKYLGLNLNDTPIADQSVEIPQWLIKSLEKHWKSDTRLKPLLYCLHDKKELFRQIMKRLPPNPIQATVQMEGHFDDRSRVTYQFRNILYRLNLMISKTPAKSLEK